MPRPIRTFIADALYHVTSRGSKKQEVFHDSADFEYFLGLLLRYVREFGVSVFHYVLMPNHIHLLMRLSIDNGSKFMQKIKSTYAMYYCGKYGTVGHVWQGRFKNVHVDTEAYLLACGNYIEMNPVRAGLVAKPEDWPYSSYHYYAKSSPDPILETSPIYLTLGRTSEERQTVYREHLRWTRAF